MYLLEMLRNAVTRKAPARIVVLAATALLASFALAQDPFDNHVADLAILQVKSVQKEIGVTEGQRSKMNVYAGQYNDQLNSYRQVLIKTKAKPDGSKVIGYQIQLRNHVFSQLSATQLKRLGQISLQHVGVAALADDVVAKKVGLSPAQLSKIRGVLVADRKKMQSMEQEAAKPILNKYQSAKPKTDAERKSLSEKIQGEMRAAAARYAPKIEKMMTDDRNQIISTLSAKQKTTWNSLLGKPFHGQ